MSRISNSEDGGSEHSDKRNKERAKCPITYMTGTNGISHSDLQSS